MYLSIQQPRKVVEDGVLLGKREAGEWSVTGRGHCSAVEDGVLLGKRESRERSVTESLRGSVPSPDVTTTSFGCRLSPVDVWSLGSVNRTDIPKYFFFL